MDVLLGYTCMEEALSAPKLLQYNTRQFLIKMVPAAKSRRRQNAQPVETKLPRIRARFPLPPERQRVRDIHIATNTERFYNDARVQFQYKPSTSARDHAGMEREFKLQLEDLGRMTERFRHDMNSIISQRCQNIATETLAFRRQRALNRWRWLRRAVLFWLRKDVQALATMQLPVEAFAHASAADFLEAIKFGKAARVRLLLNAHPKLLFERDFFRLTALHWAAKRNNVEVLLVLLEEQAYLECEDKYGLTPLHYALREKAYDTALALLVAGASPWSSGEPSLLSSVVPVELYRLVKTFRRFQITVRLGPKSERQKLFRRLVREKFNSEHLLKAIRFIS